MPIVDGKRVYSPDLIRKLIAIDRELDAQASKNWRHTHSTIVRDNDRKIVANMFNLRRPGELVSYMGWETDPVQELPDARFIVHARRALPARAEIIEQLLSRIAVLEAKILRPRPKQQVGDTCRRGHPLVGDAAMVDRHGYVRCRVCNLARQRERNRLRDKLRSFHQGLKS
jgi:hypothetical protein